MKKCLICDSYFELNSKFHRNQKYCSTQCNHNASHRRKRGLPLKLMILACEVCDKKFQQKRANNYSYCSSKCKKLGVFRKFRGLPVKGTKKHIHGSGYITSNGYKMISKNHPNAKCRSPKTGKGQIMEHIWIMSCHIGRPLFNYETVHHRNGIRNDNRLENLELWNKQHGPGQRVEDKIKWCKEFLEQYGYTIIMENKDRAIGG